MPFNRREDILFYTQQNPYDRFPDGRPKVPDELLERMKKVTVEEAWDVINRKGYKFNFEGNWFNPNPDHVMVGRAVTAMFVPTRPDLREAVQGWGREQNAGAGLENSWIIETLVENDVVVVDLFGKVRDGTFAGDNLGTAIANRTKTGMVIHGGIRDLVRLLRIPDLGIYTRGVDASAIADVTMTGFNGPVQIGNATVLPGDVVLASRGGIVFIPPHLVEDVLESSERVRKMDYWGQMRIREGKYTSGQVDGNWTDEMREDFKAWSAANPDVEVG